MTTTSPSLLVAGGTGFIGRYVCEAAHAAGYRVTTLGRGPANDLARDLRQPATPPPRVGFDHLINLAAYSDHTACAGMRAETVRLDSGRMVRRLAEYGPYRRRVIHVSTSEVFGDRRDHPHGWARVDDAYQLESAYAHGKAEQEHWADAYGYHTVRITNVWGEGQPPTKAYPRIKAAIAHGEPLTDRTGGEPVQWSWVADVARRLVELLTEPALRRHEHLAPARAVSFTRFVEHVAAGLTRPVPPITTRGPLAAALGIVPTVRLDSPLPMEDVA